MQIQIEDIKIPDRVRKDVGNIDSLAESLKRSGQITPISVTHDMTLVAGFRRVTAAKQLEWKTIEANVVEGADEARLLEIELEENVYRKDFTPEELLAGYKRLEKLRHPTVGRRIGRFFSGIWGKCAFWRRRKKKADKVPAAPEAPAQIEAPQETGETADVAAEDDGGNYGV